MRKEVTKHRAFRISLLSKSGTASCGFTGGVTYYSTPYTWTDFTDGVSVSNWQRRIKLGQNATSHRTGEIVRITARPGSAVFNYRTTATCSGIRIRERTGYLLKDMGIPGFPPPSEETTAENQARERFYSAYRSKQTAFTGGVFAGELSKTIKMLRNPAHALRKSVQQTMDTIVKNQRRWGQRKAKAYKRNRAIRDTWLEHSYGWTPLINDVKSGYEAISKYGNRRPPRVIVKGIGEVLTESYDRTAVSYSAGKLGYRVASRDTLTTFVRYKGAIRMSVDKGPLADMRYWGFSPSDIVPTIWELVPYSFLIDYFTNIGKVIDAVSMPTVHLSWGVRTLRRSAIRQSVDAESTNDYRGVVSINDDFFLPGNWRSERTAFVRSPVDSVPIPDLRFKLPNSTTQWLNIGALVRLKGLKL